MALAALLGACHPRPETGFDAQQPRTAAVRNIGSFTESLRCMDDLFAAQGKRDIYITTAGIPDATGLIAAGTKEMFISAVSRMSAKSGAFRFVDYDITQLDVQILSELVGLNQDFVAPSYYVRGAITQLDSNVLASSKSAGLSLARLDLGVSSDQVVSVISMDLNVAKLTTRQILPGISANNSIAVVRSGRGADVGGLIGKAGLSFSVSLDKSEGFAQAVRNLVELSAIEVLGKLARVPYWECLAIEPTNPAFRTEARQWFDLMGPAERQRFVEAALVRAGYAPGGGDLSPAIARYQADNDLVPSGRMDFELYYRLLASDPGRARGTRAAAAPPPAAPAPPVPVAEPAAAPATPPRLALTTARGAHPAFRVGDAMVLQARPVGDAYLYCYYQDSSGEVSRIFPNRFQPDALVAGGRAVEVPPAGGAFTIRFDRPGREQVACLAADREVGLLLPAALKRQDLEPLPLGSLDDVAARFRGIAGVRVEDVRLPIEVTR
ncbi:peptidoglycan-binding protein [Roseicella frigidaeris]|uniref:Peptidoglycan-binding protein n=1 Tax=Roseicella frigidaeris TaxID=2230885 RepID=A0A327M910_9PROT|nr:peptidoglycan-binding protein [Roseicella frigidaeris]